MERKINESFVIDGITLITKEGNDSCKGCYYYDKDVDCEDIPNLGPCIGFKRTDLTDVIFTHER